MLGRNNKNENHISINTTIYKSFCMCVFDHESLYLMLLSFLASSVLKVSLIGFLIKNKADISYLSNLVLTEWLIDKSVGKKESLRCYK